ncbi:MAG: SUMF1/EgtB/PvdO family nonheme iron enzyme [Crocinitomicaceae bacterium]|nr:SUMF1/EgtB/PvdO family nonheme iron enzyme [Crocinitomicaceae bacterium]
MKHVFQLSVFSVFFVFNLSFGKSPYKAPDGFSFIPAGSMTSNEITSSYMSMLMARHEVTNKEYRTFLNDLKTQNRNNDYLVALPDSSKWDLPGTDMQSFADHYFSHPAYDEYPVVNITAEGALLYCQWLGEKLALKHSNDQFKKMRLPLESEWIYAATAGHERVVYSWGSSRLKNEKGAYMANFKVIGDEFIRTNGDKLEVAGDAYVSYSLDNNFVTAPTSSYYPNSYNLYNMCGNVSELVVRISDRIEGADPEINFLAIGGSWNSTGYDIRITSVVEFLEANPFTGFRPVVTWKVES